MATRSFFLLGLAFLGFISIGLPDGLLGVAWPSVREHFDLPLDALGALLIMSTGGYVVSSFSSGRILKHIYVGALLALSCLATGLALLGYAVAPTWPYMVCLGLVAGAGAGAIDAAINTYAATYHGTRMLNALHAFYGIGAAIGPLLMTQALGRGLGWQRAYVWVGGAQLLLAVCFASSRHRWPAAAEHGGGTASAAAALSTLRLPVAWGGIAAFFVYTGVEATAGAWSYTLLTEGSAMDARSAGFWVSAYWAGLTVGRVLIGVFGGRISDGVLLRGCIVLIVLNALLISLDLHSGVTGISLVVIGVACGPVFPSLIAGTPARVGSAHTANLVGFQVAAAAFGQALLPALVGILADRLGIAIVGPFILVAAIVLLAVHERLVRRS